MSTDQPIRVLFVEDVPEDAELAAWTMRKEGLVFESARVDTEDDFVAALGEFRPDVIVSDYSMPQFDGMRALALSLERDRGVPFVMLTGAMNEETAVICLKAGATDYVLKERMTRLPFAIKEALQSSETVKQKQAAERALRESEAMFSGAFRASPICVMITTIPDSLIVDANEALCRAMGYERSELLGKNTVELGFWAKPDERESAFSALRTVGHIRDREAVFQTKSGECRTFLCSGEPIELAGERCVVSTAVDITDRKLAEAAVRDALEINRAIVDNSPLGLVSYRATGECIAANDAAARILGATVDQLKQQDYREIEGWRRTGLYAAACEALATGRPSTIEAEGTNTFGKHVVLRQTATSFELGGERHLMVISDDIAETRRAEAAHRESEGRFRALLDGAPEGVFVHIGDTIDFVNPALVSLVGASGPDDLIGHPFLQWIAPEYRDSVLARGCVMDATGAPAAWVDEEYLRVDGSRVPVEVSAVVCQYKGQHAHLVFVRDSSERRRAEKARAALEEQLQQSMRMESVGLLAGGVAHDFNNLLMVQKGYCELMRFDPDLDPRVLDGLTQIEVCVDRATALTRQLLAFGRKQTMQPVVLDLNPLVENIRDMLQSLVGEGVTLVVPRGPAIALVTADPVQLEQVLMNLAANARDAMPEGGRLELSVSAVEIHEAEAARHVGLVPGPFIVLTVSDTGCGMDADTKRRIFEPFFTTKSEGKGTGLGLSTVYGIVQQSGGSISVDSEPGRGSTFRVFLPRVQSEPLMDPQQEDGMANGRGELILVVEDEPALRTMVRLMVESLGYQVADAPSAAGASMLVEQEHLRPDLLLTDVVMPGTNGAALVENLRLTMPELKVIFMSGYPDTAIARHRLSDSTISFLQKPFSMSELGDKIKSVLASQSTTSGEREV